MESWGMPQEIAAAKDKKLSIITKTDLRREWEIKSLEGLGFRGNVCEWFVSSLQPRRVKYLVPEELEHCAQWPQSRKTMFRGVFNFLSMLVSCLMTCLVVSLMDVFVLTLWLGVGPHRRCRLRSGRAGLRCGRGHPLSANKLHVRPWEVAFLLSAGEERVRRRRDVQHRVYCYAVKCPKH